MPFRKDQMVVVAVVRTNGGGVVTVQQNAIQTDHTLTGTGTLDPVALSSVIWSAQNVAALWDIVVVDSVEGIVDVRPRRPDEIAVGNLPLYNNMWGQGGTVTVTLSTQPGLETITIHLRSIPTIDILALRGASSTIDPLPVHSAVAPSPVAAAVPAGFNSYQFAVTGLGSLSVSGTTASSVQLAVAEATAMWANTGAQPWTLTLRSRRGVANDDTVDSVATFAGANAGQQPTLTLRQPTALDDGNGTLIAYTAPGALLGYTSFVRFDGTNWLNVQTQTGRGVNSALPTPGAGTTTIRGLVSGNQVGTLDTDFRFTGQFPALTTNVPAGGSPSPMMIEIAHDQTAFPRVTCAAQIATRRLDDTVAPPFVEPFTIPNPGGGVTFRVETGVDGYDWLAMTESFGTATMTPPALPATNAAMINATFGSLTVGGETGNVVIDLRRNGAGNIRSTGATIGGQVAMPLPAINVTPTPLPGGRAKMLYETTLTASTTAAAGQELFWEVVSPAGLGFPTTTNTGPTNLLRSTTHLLAAWGGTNQNIVVRVTKRPMGGGAPIEGGNDVTLVLPVAASLDPSNVAIVLDRSGSMTTVITGTTNRWYKAVSGAHFFANQIAAENATRPNKHNVAVLWFGGWDTVADNYNDPSTDPFGEGNFGVLDSGGTVLDFADPSSAYLSALDAAKTSPTPLTTPKFWTAIGAGLLYGREKLYLADSGHTKERVLVCLSDGEENRPPLVATATVAPRWTTIRPSTVIGDPLTRIYAAAVDTSTAAANTLRTAVSNTGGIASLDVKEVPDDGTLIQQWFSHTFGALFDYATITAGFDPTLSSGETAAHTITVTQAHRRLVVSLFVDQAPAAPTDWSITIQPPGGGEITEADATSGTFGGVQLRAGPLYKTFVVDLPLAIPGHEHRWSGDWVFRVTRNASTAGTYIVNALAKADIQCELRVLGPASPAPGDVVTLRVDVTRDGGKPLDNCHVRAVVTPPGVWRDELVANAAATTPTTSAADGGIAWQNAVHELSKQGKFTHGNEIHINLPSVGGGGYQAVLPLTVPGGWQIDTTIDGHRPLAKKVNFSEMVQRIHEYYGPRESAGEVAIAALNTRPMQKFTLEERETLTVRFVPNADASPNGGLALGELIGLWVRPKDISGLLMGPGNGSNLIFAHEDLPRRKWPSKDSGDGTYSATVRLIAPHRPIDIRLGRLIARGLAFEDPITLRPIPRFPMTLRLDGWYALALGVKIPIKLGWKLLPFDKTRKLLPPRYAEAIGNAITAAGKIEDGRKLNEKEAKVLAGLEKIFDRTTSVVYQPTPYVAKWVENTTRIVGEAIETALLDLGDTKLGPPLTALAIGFDAARERMRGGKDDPCGHEATLESWEDLRVAVHAFRSAVHDPGSSGHGPTTD